MLRRRFGHDPVAEVEDEALLAHAVEDVGNAVAHRPATGDQDLRVEITLQRDMLLEQPGPGKRDRLIQAEARYGARLREIQVAGADPAREQDDRDLRMHR